MLLDRRRMPHLSIRNENWLMDCQLGRDHQRLDALTEKTAWKSGAQRTFQFCHHCQTWAERVFNWRQMYDSESEGLPNGRDEE